MGFQVVFESENVWCDPVRLTSNTDQNVPQ